MNQMFDSTEEVYTIRHVAGHGRPVIVQLTLCPFLIRYIFVLPVIHHLLVRQCPLVVCSLSVTCPVRISRPCVL